MKLYIELLDEFKKPLLGSCNFIICDNRKSIDTLFNEVRTKVENQRKAYKINPDKYVKSNAYFMNMLAGSSIRDAKIYIKNIQI